MVARVHGAIPAVLPAVRVVVAISLPRAVLPGGLPQAGHGAAAEMTTARVAGDRKAPAAHLAVVAARPLIWTG